MATYGKLIYLHVCAHTFPQATYYYVKVCQCTTETLIKY